MVRRLAHEDTDKRIYVIREGSLDEPQIERVEWLRATPESRLATLEDDLAATQVQVDQEVPPDPASTAVYLPGASGEYISTPDHASLDITGDLTLLVHVALTDWTPSAQQELLNKGTSAQRSYRLGVTPSGQLQFNWNPDGNAGLAMTMAGAAIIPFSQRDGAGRWVAFTFDVDNGADGYTGRFFWCPLGPHRIPEPDEWIPVGPAVTAGAAATSLFSGTAPLELGSHSAGTASHLNGCIARAVVASGFGPGGLPGGTIVADYRADRGVSPRYRDDYGRVWTVNGSAWAQALAAPYARPVGPAHDGQMYLTTDTVQLVAASDIEGVARVVEQDDIIFDPEDLDPDRRYKFYFTGVTAEPKSRVYVTFSPDGDTWSVPQRCILGASDRHAEDPGVTQHLDDPGRAYRNPDGRLTIFVEDHATGGVGTVYAYSSIDGVTWDEEPGNPAIAKGEVDSWDAAFAASPCARWDGTNYIVGYEGASISAASFGVAYGPAPTALVKSAHNPVWPVDTADPVGALVVDSMIRSGDTIYLFAHDGADSTGVTKIAGKTTVTDPTAWQSGDITLLGGNLDFVRNDATIDHSKHPRRIVSGPNDDSALASYGVVANH